MYRLQFDADKASSSSAKAALSECILSPLNSQSAGRPWAEAASRLAMMFS